MYNFISIGSGVLDPRGGGSNFPISHWLCEWLLQQCYALTWYTVIISILYQFRVFWSWIISWPWNHSLNGNSDKVNGDLQIGKFQPPTKSASLNQSKKIRHSWLCPRGDPLYQIWYKSNDWGFLGKWVKYNNKLLFIYTFFSETRVQVRPVDGFLRAIAH